MRILIPTLIVLAIVPIAANAQSQAPSAPAVHFTPEAVRRTGPTIESAAVGIRPAASENTLAAAQRSRRRSGVTHDVALMIVGGAALIAGAVIGGDAGAVFMIGGAIVGLWGLYNYLQ